MKKALSLLLALSLVFGMVSVMIPLSGAAEKGSQSIEFQDVKPTDWFYEFVMIAAENGLVNGVTTTTFAPNNNITRAQFATILYRQLGSPSVAGLPNPFKDLAKDWYKNAVIYMHSIGVINGITTDTFGPDKNITREQMVTMLFRMKPSGSITTYNASADFADGKDISSWALDAMNWAIVEGFISGTNKGLLLPKGNATRAQAAKVICLNFGLSRIPQDNVTIRFWQAGGEDENAAAVMRLLLDKFELLHPGITVDYKTVPWSTDPHIQFEEAIERGDCADLLVLGAPLDFQLAGEGKLLPLDDLLSDTVLQDLPDMLKAQSTYRGSENKDMYGKIMSVPLYSATRALIYNKEIFDFFGVAYPTEGMSHADLLEMAKKLTGEMNGKQVYGYGTRATTAEQYMNFVWNYGAQIVDPYTMTAGTDSPEWKKGIEDYIAFYNAGVTHPDAAIMAGYAQLDMFLNGEIAMFVGTAESAFSIDSTPVAEGETPWADKLGVAPLPGETYTTNYCGSDVIAVPATTENPRETALLLNYLLGTEAQVVYSRTIDCIPSVKSAAADPYFADDPIRSVYAKAMEGAHFFDNFGVTGIGTLLKQYIQLLLDGKITIEEYQAQLTEGINARIKETFG